MGFVDTNVLIYAISPSADEADKRRQARALLRQGGLALSVQVLQEFYVQVTRPTRKEPLTHAQAVRFIDALREFPVQAMTVEVFRTGIAVSQRFRLSYWDGAILAAARIRGCGVLYSEDLKHGQDYAGVRVVDPFRYE